MGSQHAKLSPSSAERWLNCAGCIRMCEDIPRKPTNVYAMTGSIAHKIGELCLIKNLDAAHFINHWGTYDYGRVDIIKGKAPTFPAQQNQLMIRIDEPIAKGVQVYVNEIRRKRTATPGSIFSSEQRLDISWLVPGMFGTGDSVIIEPLVRTYIDDYKNGFGLVEVGTPEEPNPQFAIYGVGAIGKGNPHMVEEIVMTVIQPNGLHPQGAVRSLTMTIDQLRTWVQNVLLPGAKLAMSPNAPLKTGPWCKWCEANDPNICPEIQESFEQTTQLDVQAMFGGSASNAEISLPNPALARGDQLDKILIFADICEEWFKNCRAEAYSRLKSGNPDAPKMFKLVKGKSTRSWAKTEEEVIIELQKYLTDPYAMYGDLKIRTVAQMEEVFKARGFDLQTINKLLDPLINRGSTNSTMVSVDDRRPAENPIESMFSGVDPLAM